MTPTITSHTNHDGYRLTPADEVKKINVLFVTICMSRCHRTEGIVDVYVAIYNTMLMFIMFFMGWKVLSTVYWFWSTCYYSSCLL